MTMDTRRPKTAIVTGASAGIGKAVARSLLEAGWTVGLMARNQQTLGAAADGSVLLRKMLSRPRFARFMAEQPRCRAAIEACASAYRSSSILVSFAPVGASNCVNV